MKLNKVSVNTTIDKAELLLKEEQGLSPALRAMFEMLILLIRAFASHLSVNSNNSSMPPSTDRNRKRGSQKNKSNKKPGGQQGHEGYRLEKSDNPDEIIHIKINQTTLPLGTYQDIGYESRQLIDFVISKIVTEYRAQIVKDAMGKQYIAPFPDHVKTDVQYGYRVKSHAVYLSQFQFLPYARAQSYFEEKMNMSISTGSIFNFNKEAYLLLEQFEAKTKLKLLAEKVLNADETGINVNKKTIWLHSVSSDSWSYFYPHEKRGSEAMDEMGILPQFTGTLIHDHWKPYFTYSCKHGLCNAHHIRELTYAHEEDKQLWAHDMKLLLLELNNAVNATDINALSPDKCTEYKNKYRNIIQAGELESPLPEPLLLTQPKRRGRVKKTKSRNLLERLRDFERETLRFMENPWVPFTNNSGENDLRMTKVQQKISGCFRSMEGARIFCRIRGYLLTCQKHNVTMTEALELLFQGKLPLFIMHGNLEEKTQSGSQSLTFTIGSVAGAE